MSIAIPSEWLYDWRSLSCIHNIEGLRVKPMNRLAVIVLLASSTLVVAQSSVPKRTLSTAPIDSLLAPPMEWRYFSTRMFQDSQVNIVFNLTTSWIPGPDHKGSFRFKMTVTTKKPLSTEEQDKSPELYSPEATEKLLRRVNDCLIEMELYDTDGFILRDVAIPFSLGMGSSGKVVTLSANNAVQMDAEEYKKFLFGSWVVTWTVPPRSR
jgi:hypothetical protein